jgi:hypothetical protein
MKYKLILLAAIFLFVTACSKDDNPTGPTTDSFITGEWKAGGFTASSGNIDSVEINVQLSGNDGAFTGSGTITFGGRENGTNYVGYFNDEIKGTYSENSISMTSKNNVTGDTFSFSGNKDTDEFFNSWSFRGTATYVISGTSRTYEINFYKNE